MARWDGQVQGARAPEEPEEPEEPQERQRQRPPLQQLPQPVERQEVRADRQAGGRAERDDDGQGRELPGSRAAAEMKRAAISRVVTSHSEELEQSPAPELRQMLESKHPASRQDGGLPPPLPTDGEWAETWDETWSECSFGPDGSEHGAAEMPHGEPRKENRRGDPSVASTSIVGKMAAADLAAVEAAGREPAAFDRLERRASMENRLLQVH